MSRAQARFRSFHHRDPKDGELYVIRREKDVDAFKVGELVGVIYQSAGDGKTYIHRFAKHARPVLAVTHDGKQFHALAGAYGFDERGFVDSPRNRKRK